VAAFSGDISYLNHAVYVLLRDQLKLALAKTPHFSETLAVNHVHTHIKFVNTFKSKDSVRVILWSTLNQVFHAEGSNVNQTVVCPALVSKLNNSIPRLFQSALTINQFIHTEGWLDKESTKLRVLSLATLSNLGSLIESITLCVIFQLCFNSFNFIEFIFFFLVSTVFTLFFIHFLALSTHFFIKITFTSILSA